jgi:hypothetical protein
MAALDFYYPLHLTLKNFPLLMDLSAWLGRLLHEGQDCLSCLQTPARTIVFENAESWEQTEKAFSMLSVVL